MKTSPRSVSGVTSALLLLPLAATACSGDEPSADPSAAPSSVAPQPTEEPTDFQVQTRTTISTVAGKLAPGQRKQVVDDVTDVVQAWFNAAYVAGPWPRTDFAEAFPGFTPAAEERARQDLKLMTSKGIGSRVTGVTPTTSRVRLDVLAAGKRPVGVTARFQLKFSTEGDLTQRIRVKGRLLLTPDGGSWQIFGYDVAKGARA